jgi:hypothetical protein
MKGSDNVYILQAGDYIKVGVSNNIKNRINQMQTGNPKKINLIAKRSFNKRSEAFYIEGVIHQFLKDHRQSGEWFCVTPSMFNSLIEKFGIKKIAEFNEESEMFKMASNFDRRIAEEKSLSMQLRKRDKGMLTKKIGLEEGVKARERIIDLIKMDIKLITNRYDDINDTDYAYLEAMKSVKM